MQLGNNRQLTSFAGAVAGLVIAVAVHALAAPVQLTPIAFIGQRVPGLPNGNTYSYVLGQGIDANGTVEIYSLINGPDVPLSATQALFRWNTSTGGQIVAQRGVTQMPG